MEDVGNLSVWAGGAWWTILDSTEMQVQITEINNTQLHISP